LLFSAVWAFFTLRRVVYIINAGVSSSYIYHGKSNLLSNVYNATFALLGVAAYTLIHDLKRFCSAFSALFDRDDLYIAISHLSPIYRETALLYSAVYGCSFERGLDQIEDRDFGRKWKRIQSNTLARNRIWWEWSALGSMLFWLVWVFGVKHVIGNRYEKWSEVIERLQQQYASLAFIARIFSTGSGKTLFFVAITLFGSVTDVFLECLQLSDLSCAVLDAMHLCQVMSPMIFTRRNLPVAMALVARSGVVDGG
jgi:hypothetical protein